MNTLPQKSLTVACARCGRELGFKYTDDYTLAADPCPVCYKEKFISGALYALPNEHLFQRKPAP